MRKSRAFAEMAKDYVQSFMKNNRVLIHYLRHKDRTPYGVVVSFKDGGEVRMGHSTPNFKAGDTYTKHTLVYVAIQRALANPSVPTHMKAKKLWDRMVERSEKYFKPTSTSDERSALPGCWGDNINAIFGGHRLEKVCRDV